MATRRRGQRGGGGGGTSAGPRLTRACHPCPPLLLLCLTPAVLAAPCLWVDYGDTATQISMQSCTLTTVPPAPARLTAVTTVLLHDNTLNHFPDLTALGSKLTVLNIMNNKIPNPDPSLLTPLVALRSVRMTTNSFTDFPDFTASATTITELWGGRTLITDPPPALTTPFTALDDLRLNNNLLTTMPDFTGSSLTLRILYLSTNQIRSVSAALLRPLVNLQELYLHENPLTALPHLPELVSLTKLDLRSTLIIQLPPLWPQNPAGFTLSLTSSSVDVCNCRNLWLKESAPTYASVAVDDQTCGADLWSLHSVTSLNSSCTEKAGPATLRKMTARVSAVMAPLPTSMRHSHIPGLEPKKCVKVCSRQRTCVGFWTHQSAGGCVLMAPAPGSAPAVTDAAAAVWRYHGAAEN